MLKITTVNTLKQACKGKKRDKQHFTVTLLPEASAIWHNSNGKNGGWSGENDIKEIKIKKNYK